MNSFRFLSVDFGDSYVGLAVSNGFLSIPLDVFSYRKNDLTALTEHLLGIINKNSTEIVVVGKPLNLQLALKIDQIFSNDSQIGIFRNMGIEVFFINEEYTTKEALLIIGEKKKKKREDSIAASIILDRFFYPEIQFISDDDYE